jgi:hypothetical protein
MHHQRSARPGRRRLSRVGFLILIVSVPKRRPGSFKDIDDISIDWRVLYRSCCVSESVAVAIRHDQLIGIRDDCHIRIMSDYKQLAPRFVAPTRGWDRRGSITLASTSGAIWCGQLSGHLSLVAGGGFEPPTFGL